MSDERWYPPAVFPGCAEHPYAGAFVETTTTRAFAEREVTTMHAPICAEPGCRRPLLADPDWQRDG